MHHRNMFGLFKGCRLARMSSGRYCLVRDLGLVKGGKGMRHHEVVIAFSLRASRAPAAVAMGIPATAK